MKQPRKRVIRIGLTARQKQDPQAILDAARAALNRNGMTLRVDTVPEDCGEHTLAQEQLEAAALSRVARALNEANREEHPQVAQPTTQPADSPKSLWEKPLGQVFKEVAVWFAKLPGKVVSFSVKEALSAFVKRNV